ncbi:aldo/keto reductase [Corynebacterium tapiri]|uniref:Aldo/keto reductase n=1 Tax=Corynebacterium tapiri TaxID=1448266 RepID=A0A5C4U679_9CORY|nr:aldo/keto reductase [Corynebacterium tapiri]TNM00396.1 aldo/keto reductase [Corynebacterium tapiri]
MSNTPIPTFSLIDGAEMPQIGFGTYKLHGDEAVRMVREAIAAGYRHIDTASLYDNEGAVGQGIRDAIAAGDVTREELFVATKAWNNEQGKDEIPQAFRRSLARLGLDYLDLYLLHWPWPQRGLYNESFEAMAKLQGLGDVQSIGVCNFYEEVLQDLVDATGVTPAINQVEMHVGFSQAPLRQLHSELGVVGQAWAPLGRGVLMENPEVRSIAANHGVSEAQIVLAYLLNKGVSVIPKTATPARLLENAAAVDIELEPAELASLDALDGVEGIGRLSGDPREFPGEVRQN